MLPVRFMRACGTQGFPETAPLARWGRGWDHIFDDVFAGVRNVSFRVDVREDGDNLIIDAELPGLSQDDVEISVEDNTLSISASYKTNDEDKQENYHIRERGTGSLQRSFKLPATVDTANVSATLTNGVLSVRIPTREEAKPRRIAVK